MHKFFKRVFYTSFVCIFTTALFADLTVQDFAKPSGEQEALFLRRIVAFFEEDKTEIAKNEIENYLQASKDKDFSDYLKALLGNIYFNDKKYQEASNVYKKISSRTIKEKVLANRVQADWEIKDFNSVITEALEFMTYIASLQNKEDADRFYFFIGDAYYQEALAADKEKKAEYAKKAYPYFEKLSKEKAHLKPTLAHIFFMLEDYRSAADTYLMASEVLEDQKEELLFKAASIQVKYDKEKAVNTFSQVCQLNKARSSDAAFNKMVLLTELGRYSDLLLAKEQMEALLDKTQKEKLCFLTGKAYLSLNDYQHAGQHLIAFLESPQGARASKESQLALLMLFSAGKKSEEIGFLDISIQKIEELFPEEQSLPSAYFVRALLHKKKENFKEARKDFETLETKYKEFAKKDEVMIEAGAFYYETEDFLKSRLVFKSFIDTYKEHKLAPLAWRYFINSSIKLIDTTSPDKIMAARAVLSEDLSVFLSEKGFCNESEKMEYGFILAKTIYDMNNYDEAFMHMQYLFEYYPQIQRKAEAHFLMGALKNKTESNDSYLDHFEKAIALDPDQNLDHIYMRLTLFNGYLEKAKTDKKYFDLAAEHFYQAQKEKSIQPLIGNLLWLADFYFKKVDSYLSESHQHSLQNVALFHQRANELLDRILDENYQGQEIVPSKAFLEDILFKKAVLLGYSQQKDKQKELLLKLQENYEKKADVQWKGKAKTYFNLAKIFLEQNTLLALEYFEKVINLNERDSLSLKAKLEEARIQFYALDRNSITIENGVFYKVLSCLKNLKMQRNLKTEPVHLEAALDYIEVEIALLPTEQEKLFKKLELLNKTRTDFTSKADVLSKDYQASLKRFPKKAKLVRAYLAYMDAEIEFTAAKLKGFNQDLVDKAASLYRQIVKDELVVTAYLDKKIKESFKEIEALSNK